MVFNKKAISPVVATALLLVVAVVAVVGFQTWFTTFQSKSFVDIEQKTDTGVSVSISRLARVGSNSEVLVFNNAASQVEVSKVVVSQEGNSDAGCTSSTARNLTAKSVSSISLNSCGVTKGVPADVVLITENGVIEARAMVK